MRLLFFSLLTILAAAAQPIAFEVASVKSSTPMISEGGRRNVVERQPVALTIRNATLSFCLQWAYGVKFYQISGPAWLNQERYDILAKAPAPVAPVELRRMLQTLLAGRFNLSLHRETKRLPVYELVAAKSGTKRRKAAPAGASDMRVANGSFVFRYTTTAELAGKLSDLAGIDRPVIDRTTIPGVFDFTLSGVARRVAEGDAQAIFEAIEQLGLRMEPRQGPVEMLLIDRVQKVPIAN